MSAKPGIPTVMSNDRTSFVGARVPEEIKVMIKNLQYINHDIFRKLLKVCISYLEGQKVYEGALSKISVEVSEEVLSYIYAGIHTILHSALRLSQTSLKSEVFKEDLKELKLPEDYITDLNTIVYGPRRVALDKHIVETSGKLPTLQDFRWRVDVAISTSALSRVLEPTILMEITLSDGTVKTFEVPLSKFHDLRFSVANILKEMEDLEKRSILKIQD